MEIKSSLVYGALRSANEAKEAKQAKVKEKESRLFTGSKMNASSDDAVSLEIKAKAAESNEYALENVNASASAAEDVAKAADMIQQANSRILKNSGDSVLAQANQTTDVVTKLLD